MNFLKSIFGDFEERKIKALEPIVEEINSFEAKMIDLDDSLLKGKTSEFKDRLQQGETLEDILPEAFAVVREASKRVMKQRHFDVQLLGGIVLHRGNIAEMRTGEGKTLVATLPAYLNALSGNGVHVVTVNDYLACRDAAWMGQIYTFLGLTVGVVNQQVAYLYKEDDNESDVERDAKGSYKVVYDFLKTADRHEAYAADITYGTNNAFGFDYLRDNLVHDKKNISQKTKSDGRYNYAIIDEVDSILIDESRTPLIIAGPAEEAGSLYKTFSSLVKKLEPGADYEVDRKLKAISVTDQGIEKAEKALGIDNFYTEGGIKYVHHLETAIRAEALYEKDKDYVIKDGEIIIVDEFTGRLQPGRRWSEGLHQAVEAKENVDIKAESRTYGSVTLQNYFRLYDKLAGMTGTAATSREEFEKVYGLDVYVVPTNKEPKRKDHSDLIFQTEKGKFKALSKRVKELHEKGQPVLIGTVSIEKNELLSAYLRQEGIPHEVLNAKNHEQEGQITAQAGGRGKVVIATNMAGRGVDIKLGGAGGTTESYEEIKDLGGLFVIGTERHEARRIDNQLRGRSGRQGDPGETQFFVSMEDSLMKIFASDRVKNMMGRFGIPEDEPIQNSIISKAIENAQSKIEGMHFDTRKHLLEYDDVVNHQRVTLYDRRRDVLFADEVGLKKFVDRAIEFLNLESEESNKLEEIFQQKVSTYGESFIKAFREVILQVIDMNWMEHLEAVDYMKGSVRLRAYGQRDPLVEFKKEGLRLFRELETNIFEGVMKLLPNIEAEVKTEEHKNITEIHDTLNSLGVEEKTSNKNTPQTNDDSPKVGRNDLCPCGSGKKYKKCHGQ
ncbi:MAG TPA: preprotein translocase subunit SecA [Candidatus Paceibacterota bacterium]